MENNNNNKPYKIYDVELERELKTIWHQANGLEERARELAKMSDIDYKFLLERSKQFRKEYKKKYQEYKHWQATHGRYSEPKAPMKKVTETSYIEIKEGDKE